MAMMTVAMAPTNRQNTASQKVEHASVICSRATTATAFQEFTFAVSFLAAEFVEL